MFAAALIEGKLIGWGVVCSWQHPFRYLVYLSDTTLTIHIDMKYPKHKPVRVGTAVQGTLF